MILRNHAYEFSARVKNKRLELTRVFKLSPFIMGANDELKIDMEYWSNLSEESFQMYLNSAKDHELNELFLLDGLRDVIDKAKKATSLFLDSFDIMISSIQDIEKFKIIVRISTSRLKSYLDCTIYIDPFVLNSYIEGFYSKVNEHFSSVVEYLGKWKYNSRIFFLFI